MQVITQKKKTTSELTTARVQTFRKTAKGRKYEQNRLANLRTETLSRIPEFVGVDSEGVGRGKNHRAVLLGVGDQQYVARDHAKGLHWQEVFSFLYGEFTRKPAAAFVGFYLGYDFNQWLRSLPQKAAWYLLSKEGRAVRRRNTVSRSKTYPVRCEGWEIDMLGFKRLSIRPRVCECIEQKIKCQHKHNPWMHICDAGPFFQTAFLNVIDPEKWKIPVCTTAEYETVLAGKNERATARLNAKMKFYNRLENELLSRVMKRLAEGFKTLGIGLAKDQWYGPGACASKWLTQKKAVKRRNLETIGMPQWFQDVCHYSYFGGWFEIFSHGIIRGESYNYDINNAYPYATTKLPHICENCRYERGMGNYTGDASAVLVYATVFSSGHRMGAVPYRDKDGNILRPGVSKGWYWRDEIDAANRAGLVKKVTYHEWAAFYDCHDGLPFGDIQRLYDLRLSVGKDTPQGMGIKLLNNSLYGKFAQSVGSAPFGNWFYASRITSHCRIQILDAIASHPGKANAALMVATDGVCFDSPHPSLPVSKSLGDWSTSVYTDLCLFKPGVYWHKEGKEALLKVKSRGVAKHEFMEAISGLEHQFGLMLQEGSFPGKIIEQHAIEMGINMAWLRTEKGWPFCVLPVKFRMKSCAQALNEGDWGRAGQVERDAYMRQDSDPSSKRRGPHYNRDKQRIDSYFHDLSTKELQTHYHGQVKMKPDPDVGFSFDGSPTDPILQAVQTARDKQPNYDIDLSDIEWENVWNG